MSNQIKEQTLVNIFLRPLESHLFRDVLQICLLQLSGLVVDQVDGDQRGESEEEQEEDALGADAGTLLGLALAAPSDRTILLGIGRTLGLREALLLRLGVAGHVFSEVDDVL